MAAKTTPVAEAPEETQPTQYEPVLRINTKNRDRQRIEIDGKFYDLRRIGEFGIGKQQRLNRDGREFYNLWTSAEELDDDQQKELKFLLERMYAEVLDAPKTVAKLLDDSEKADVVLTFTLAPLQKAMAAAQAQTDQPEETKNEARESESITTS